MRATKFLVRNDRMSAPPRTNFRRLPELLGAAEGDYLSAMATRAQPAPGRQIPVQADLLDMYRLMLLSAAHRRQGDPAQAAEQDLLPNLGCGSRRVLVAAGKPSARVRLVLSHYRDRALLFEPRDDSHEMLLSAVGAAEDPNSVPPDALPLGPQGTQHRSVSRAHRHAAAPGRGLCRGMAPLTTESTRSRKSRYMATSSCTCRGGRHDGAKGSSGRRSNTASNLRLPVLFPHRGQQVRDLGPRGGSDGGRARCRSTCGNFPASWSRKSRRCDPSPPTTCCCEPRIRPPTQGARAGACARDQALLALALGRRSAVQAAQGPGEEARRGIASPCSPSGLIADGVAAEAEIRPSSVRWDEEVGVAATWRWPRPSRSRRRPAVRVFARRRSHVRTVRPEDDPRFGGDPTTMVDLLNACMKDENGRVIRASWCSARTWRTSQSRAAPGPREGQGWRLRSPGGCSDSSGAIGSTTHRSRKRNIVGRAIGLATAA